MATICNGPLSTGANVLYACSCKEMGEIERMYFCRHCMKLRCIECVSNEVESFYCPTCLESVPSGEAKQKKNRCNNCLECPVCDNTLSVVSTINDEEMTSETGDKETNPPATEANEQPQDDGQVKRYFLSCGFCRWTSREIDMEDREQSSGNWPELTINNSNKIDELLEYYRNVDQVEKAEKEMKVHKRRRSTYMTLGSGKINSFQRRSMQSRTANLNVIGTNTVRLVGGQEIKPMDVSIACENPEPVPDYILESETIEMSGLMQRLSFPNCQPSKIKEVIPNRKHLLAKKSQRCRECEHNLCKPEFNPSSIKFKIQLVAWQYTPRIIISQVPELLFNQENKVVLTAINPLDTTLKIQLLPWEPNEDEPVNFSQTAKIFPPDNELVLSAKDDAADFDYSETPSSTYNDDPRIVLARRANRLSIYCRVVPERAFGEVKCALVLKYDGQSIKKGDLEEPWIEHIVHFTLGSVSTKPVTS